MYEISLSSYCTKDEFALKDGLLLKWNKEKYLVKGIGEPVGFGEENTPDGGGWSWASFNYFYKQVEITEQSTGLTKTTYGGVAEIKRTIKSF